MEFTVCGVHIKVTFGFFALWAVILSAAEYFPNNALSPLPVFLLCLLHESGHIAALTLTGCPPRGLTFYAGGISMSLSEPPERAGLFTEILVLSAGCAVNLALSVILSLAGNRLWALASLGLGLFNLLPHSLLDGGGILRALTVCLFPEADVEAAQQVCDKVILLAALAFVLLKGISPAMLSVLITLLAVCKREKPSPC